MYIMRSIKELSKIDCLDVKWLKIPDDFIIFKEHLLSQKKVLTIDEWCEWKSIGIDYCGLIINQKMVARSCVERYSENKWETADVRVLPSERGKGYGKQVVYFVTKYILDKGKIATCRTNINNKPMQKLILSLGFKLI